MPMRNPVAPKKVLVTGAAGFLGSHLCDALLSRGHRVIGVDNLSTGSRDNLRQWASESRHIFLEADVTGDLEGAIRHATSPEAIACSTSARDRPAMSEGSRMSVQAHVGLAVRAVCDVDVVAWTMAPSRNP